MALFGVAIRSKWKPGYEVVQLGLAGREARAQYVSGG
jgi:hypothetical protein